MKLKVQLVVCTDDGREEQVQEVATLDKDCQRIEHLDLTLVEAKQLLATLQQHLVAQQASAFVATCARWRPVPSVSTAGSCSASRASRRAPSAPSFGTVALTSPRLYHCRCQRWKTTTFRPLNALLPAALVCAL